MKRLAKALALIAFLIIIGAKNMEDEKTVKIIQVQIIKNDDTKILEADINKFLTQNKVVRSSLIDIKFITNEGMRRAMIIYEIEFKEDK